MCVCAEIIEKTASYVARVGETFEKKLALKEQNNPKFAFLRPTDAYHTYYRARVSYFQHNSSTPAAPGAAAASATASSAAKGPETSKKPAKPEPVTEKTLVAHGAETISAPSTARMLKPPSKDRFSFNPPHIPLQDLFVTILFHCIDVCCLHVGV